MAWIVTFNKVNFITLSVSVRFFCNKRKKKKKSRTRMV